MTLPVVMWEGTVPSPHGDYRARVLLVDGDEVFVEVCQEDRLGRDAWLPGTIEEGQVLRRAFFTLWQSRVTAPKTPTHVSSDGALRLPERVLEIVGVVQGGSVSFVDKGEGVVEMMSDETFLRRAGLTKDGSR